jgi:hypothetical protein
MSGNVIRNAVVDFRLSAVRKLGRFRVDRVSGTLCG